MKKLSHLDQQGNAIMVDVGQKENTERMARATGTIQMNDEAFTAIIENRVPKGDVFATARIAGIMATKRTSELIPLCHPLLLSSVTVSFESDPEKNQVHCECVVRLCGKTGAEMEALTGVTTALLTIYDMCKALDKSMTIKDVCLLEKAGGKSGHYVRKG